MAVKLSFLTISAAFLLLGIIMVSALSIQNKSGIVTSSNIIFRYGVSGAEHMNELNTFKGVFIKDMVNKDPLVSQSLPSKT